MYIIINGRKNVQSNMMCYRKVFSQLTNIFMDKLRKLDFICMYQEAKYILPSFKKEHWVQVNLCQKLLFLHQLAHNMTTDCSFFMKIVSSEYLQNMLCTQIVVFVLTFRTILVHNMFCRCCELLKKI